VYEEKVQMPIQSIHLTPKPDDPDASKTPAETQKLEEQKKMEHVADEAAEQAGKTEQRYDQDHDLFTK
jgi:hypothetical protein